MSKNIDQVYVANPSTTLGNNDLLYAGQSPYGAGNDTAIKYSDLAAQIAASGVTPLQVQQSAFNVGTDTGTANNYVVSLNPAITSYTDKLIVIFTPLNSNTTAGPHINVNGQGSVMIKGFSNDVLAPADLEAGTPAILIYDFDDVSFKLLNPQRTLNVPYALQNNTFIAGVDTGIVDAYQLNLIQATGAYAPNQLFIFTPANTNVTTTPTVQINGLGAKTIVKQNNTAVAAGDIVANIPAIVVYTGNANFELINPQTTSGGSSPWTAGAGTGSAIGGDGVNTAAGNGAISFGSGNSNAGTDSVVFGANNSLPAGRDYCFVTGYNNTLSFGSSYTSILAGINHTGGGYYSAIVCGYNNQLQSGNSQCIVNGRNNKGQGDYSLIGGYNCQVDGSYAFGYGLNVTVGSSANHNVVLGNGASSTFAGCFVWSDSNATGNAPSAANQFVATAQNGYRFYGGNLNIMTAGSGLSVKSGANCKIGTATLVAGTVTVSNTSVTANSLILLTVQVAGGTQGNLSIGTVVAGTSFDINSDNAADTSTVGYMIVEKG